MCYSLGLCVVFLCAEFFYSWVVSRVFFPLEGFILWFFSLVDVGLHPPKCLVRYLPQLLLVCVCACVCVCVCVYC